MLTRISVVSTMAAVWISMAATCLAGFSENPVLPRLRQVNNEQWSEHYAMASTANPGTFVITTEYYETLDTFEAPPGGEPERWNDHLVVRAYCYETNTETSITLSTWKQGSGAVVSGGFPPCYYWTYHFSPKDPLECYPSLWFGNFTEFMEIVKVDITKDALPPAAGQTWGRLYATVNTEVTGAGGPGPENMLWAFEVSRDATGQPTITPVHCPQTSCGGYTPDFCDNAYYDFDSEDDTITQGIYSFPNNDYPGLIRYTVGADQPGNWDMMNAHCVTVNKRPGSPPTYEAWIWWNETRILHYMPGTYYKKRIFGYRIDGAGEQWTALLPTTLRPDQSEPVTWYPLSMDACCDPVGGKVWFQISESDAIFQPTMGVTTACWIPSSFDTHSNESALYNTNFTDYSDAAANSVGGELLLSDEPGRSEGTIDSTWHTGTQGCVFGTFRNGPYLKAYRITSDTLTLDPGVLQDWYIWGETPDVTCFGNPNATSQYGRPAGTSYAYSNPHGGVVASQDGSNNLCTSLIENGEVSTPTIRSVTKDIPLSRNQWGDAFSLVDLTSYNRRPKVSQVKKRLDQSAANQTRDRELFYTWMGIDAQDNKVLAIKRSSTQAFRFGINYQSDGYQWFNNSLTPVGSAARYFGDGNWHNGYYNNGALAEFKDVGLAGFRSGDQIFNAVFEGNITTNELVYSIAYAGLIDNPTIFNDPADAGLYTFLETGQTGWRSVDVSTGWNFFKERPWDYNYFHLRLPDWNIDEGAVLNQSARLWCYWLDWQ